MIGYLDKTKSPESTTGPGRKLGGSLVFQQ